MILLLVDELLYISKMAVGSATAGTFSLSRYKYLQHSTATAKTAQCGLPCMTDEIQLTFCTRNRHRDHDWRCRFCPVFPFSIWFTNWCLKKFQRPPWLPIV